MGEWIFLDLFHLKPPRHCINYTNCQTTEQLGNVFNSIFQNGTIRNTLYTSTIINKSRNKTYYLYVMINYRKISDKLRWRLTQG